MKAFKTLVDTPNMTNCLTNSLKEYAAYDFAWYPHPFAVITSVVILMEALFLPGVLVCVTTNFRV